MQGRREEWLPWTVRVQVGQRTGAASHLPLPCSPPDHDLEGVEAAAGADPEPGGGEGGRRGGGAGPASKHGS